MKRIFAKIVIAIAFGILIGDLAGTHANVHEINTKLRYKPEGVKVEKQFHRKTALISGAITIVIAGIILLIPEFKRKKQRK
ncbi:MAG: hypothetical protein JWN78_2377 [Bacteroidota bacterium]|nr:hypothetical protein [Bacteroidota bacterium]